MEAKRLAVGFGWGVVVTIAMLVLIILSVLTGLSPMPSPIPEVIVNKGLGLLGVGLPGPLIMLLAVDAHLYYGGGINRTRAAMGDRGGRVQARPLGLAGSGDLRGRCSGHAGPAEDLALPIHSPSERTTYRKPSFRQGGKGVILASLLGLRT